MDLHHLISALMLLAAGLAVFPAPSNALPWRCWGLAGITAGLAQLCVIIWPDQPLLGTARGVLIAASGLLLVEAARRVWNLRQAWLIHLTLGGLALALATTPLGLEVATVSTCALPGCAVTAGLWWRLSRAHHGLARAGHLLVTLVCASWTLAMTATLIGGWTGEPLWNPGWGLHLLAGLSLLSLFLGLVTAVTTTLPSPLARQRRLLALATIAIIGLLLSAHWLTEGHGQRTPQVTADLAQTQGRGVATCLKAQGPPLPQPSPCCCSPSRWWSPSTSTASMPSRPWPIS
jgi:hypothetical protein